MVERETEVCLQGGSLIIGWSDDNRVSMTGPAVESFRGDFDFADYGVSG
jgi:diaminopimelate epimerase